MKKRYYLLLLLFSGLLFLTLKKHKIYYIPFGIPGDQMAATVPPLGIFIESEFKKDKSMLRHELAHWDQYERMGFLGFYTTYLTEWFRYGRMNGPMEVEARKKSRSGNVHKK